MHLLGRARARPPQIRDPCVDELDQIEEGEVLVAPTTPNELDPVFGKISAAVLNIGIVMSHTAILPAVIGTSTATKRIRSAPLRASTFRSCDT
jgi:pyruvate, water dikinase